MEQYVIEKDSSRATISPTFKQTTSGRLDLRAYIWQLRVSLKYAPSDHVS